MLQPAKPQRSAFGHHSPEELAAFLDLLLEANHLPEQCKYGLRLAGSPACIFTLAQKASPNQSSPSLHNVALGQRTHSVAPPGEGHAQARCCATCRTSSAVGAPTEHTHRHQHLIFTARNRSLAGYDAVSLDRGRAPQLASDENGEKTLDRSAVINSVSAGSTIVAQQIDAQGQPRHIERAPGTSGLLLTPDVSLHRNEPPVPARSGLCTAANHHLYLIASSTRRMPKRPTIRRQP